MQPTQQPGYALTQTAKVNHPSFTLPDLRGGQYVVGHAPAIGRKGMHLHDSLTGRKEKRLPVVVVVNLAPLEPHSPERNERTYTDNVSAHGARVRSAYAWQLGEQAEITPANGETPVRGEVVYCEKLDNDGFFVGLKFPESRIPWSILQV